MALVVLVFLMVFTPSTRSDTAAHSTPSALDLSTIPVSAPRFNDVLDLFFGLSLSAGKEYMLQKVRDAVAV